MVQVGPGPGFVPVATFVARALEGIDRGRDEVPVGLARVLVRAARVAPGLFLRILNNPRP